MNSTCANTHSQSQSITAQHFTKDQPGFFILIHWSCKLHYYFAFLPCRCKIQLKLICLVSQIKNSCNIDPSNPQTDTVLFKRDDSILYNSTRTREMMAPDSSSERAEIVWERPSHLYPTFKAFLLLCFLLVWTKTLFFSAQSTGYPLAHPDTTKASRQEC